MSRWPIPKVPQRTRSEVVEDLRAYADYGYTPTDYQDYLFTLLNEAADMLESPHGET